MAIKSVTELNKGKIQIDLTGPQGNAYYLIGFAQKNLKDVGKTRDEITTLIEEMKSSDYDNLITIFDRKLGNYVDLFR